jgi:hypothetical protein
MTVLTTKSMATLIALFLMFAITASLVVIPVANAHDPPLSWPTYAFCSVAPNPIGVGQTVNVNFWLALPPPTASAQYGDRWQNMYVEVTRPDGHVDRLGPFTSDATGGTHTTYTPNTVGEYTFQMIFEGETLAGNNLGSDPSAYPEIGDYYEPSESNIMTLVVQDEPIAEPKVNPLPTQYWTRPIYGENNAWYTISGAWLGLAASTFAATGMYNATGNYNPYTTAPNSAHILWTKPEAFGGIIGGEFGGSQTANYYSTSQYEPKFAPIIMQGILYYTMYPGSSTYPQGWAAVDLHTGETLWTSDVTNEVLKCGQPIRSARIPMDRSYSSKWLPSSGTIHVNVRCNDGSLDTKYHKYSVNDTHNRRRRQPDRLLHQHYYKLRDRRAFSVIKHVELNSMH